MSQTSEVASPVHSSDRRRVKVVGAGSIGNHLSNASRQLGWSVDLCDIDVAALERTRNEIYPGRYGSWDPEINLLSSENAGIEGYDYVMIGTPPPAHIPLASAALEGKPKAILVEKPICTPDLAGAQELVTEARSSGVALFAGYDHVVGKASQRASELLAERAVGEVLTLDVEFREHWGGILAAHPWLAGPQHSYLGFWKQGGGACGEHSHALNLWQHFAHCAGLGPVVEVQATLDYKNDGVTDYDQLCCMNLNTRSGVAGRVVQDVVTQPPRKWARIQGSNGFLEWHAGYKPGCDAVIMSRGGEDPDVELIEKTRPDDFIQELRHIDDAMRGDPAASPISIERGLDTMLAVAAAHMSAAERRTISIDYSAGYGISALR